ncbi:Centromere/kinetochore protein zw10-like [Pseudocercospora fuligena]|uniref:Centromere/kinetochore protein zw10-like n=1 Tax=Pseudocercospora fuligena TaxID=685502 RepID=A0A8H6RQM0_9PEZI|nr:Centromere/kinetochore protein zw10-like [Pseudocercospora fuligena]
MAADILTPAVLSYIDHGAFPQNEDVASASLSPDHLQALGSALKHEQDQVKGEIRSLSKSTAGDVDTWIVRAKELQADILRSRETARQIVAEAEAGKELKAKALDKKRKVELLEKEVAVNEGIVGRLEHVKHAHNELGEIREALVSGSIEGLLVKLEQAEESILGVGDAYSGVSLVLQRKAQKLREGLRETVQTRWGAAVHVDVENRSVTTKDSVKPIVEIAQGLGLFDDLVANLTKNVEKAIFRPRLAIDRQSRVPAVQISGSQLALSPPVEDCSLDKLLKDLRSAIDYLAEHLPADVASPLSQHLVPALSARLEDEWLEPAVPLDISEMSTFHQILADVEDFASHIEQVGWQGSKSLHAWVQAAPKTWLTKRREGLLGDVRNFVFTGIRDSKTVERVETQMVSQDDALAGGGGEGEDDWDTAWDEPDDTSAAPAPQQSATPPAEDEDMSAWDEDDTNDPAKEEDTKDEDDAWDAWGEGDDNGNEPTSAPAAPATPKAPKQQATLSNGEPANTRPSEREVTLRETFKVTAVPDGILDLLQQVITDATTLAGPEHSNSPIKVASQGLYTLPTLALAIYRATAPTAYAKLDTGNMLIYNDAMRLADQLRAWQADQPSQSRLRLDNDVKALEQFAKRAYSAEMDSQRTILLDQLEGAQGFSRCSEQPFKSECESAVEQAVLRLRDVQRMWESILSNSALLQSIGSLLSTLIAKMIRDVEDLPDIGEADSKELKALCEAITETKDIFTQAAPDGSQRDMAFVYCPNWLKFQYLGEILVGTLADIRYLWSEGELSLEFEAEEVVGLIEALFAESRHRREAIQQIRRGGRA